MKTENEKTFSAIVEGFVIDHARSIQINTGDKIILMQVKGKRIITTVYEQGSLERVAYHGAKSGKELCAMFNQMGICIWILTKQLIAASFFWKRGETLCIELLPRPLEK